MAQENNGPGGLTAKILSRKFILATIGLFLGAALLLAGKLSGGEFVTLTLGLSGAYMTANAWGKSR